MGYIRLTSVTLNVTPAVNQTLTVSYRLQSVVDLPGNYTPVSGSVRVTPAGLIVNPTTGAAQPLDIPGLTDGETYVVKCVNNCGGAGNLQTYAIPQPVTTAAPTTAPATTLAPCPDITSIIGTPFSGTP